MNELKAHVQELEQHTGLKVDVVEMAGTNQVFVVLRKVVLPPNMFKLAETDVLFIADRQYPLSALDMFWTELDVIRPDGTIPQSAEHVEQYLDRQWRRFSWHNNGVWNPSSNGILDHFAFMEARWLKEAC